MKVALKEINIYEIEKLYKKIFKDVSSVKSSYTLNLENVEKIDLSGVQLILSLKKYCDKNGITLKIININFQQLIDIFELFSLNKSLEL